MQYPVIDLISQAYLNNGWTGLENISILPSGYTELEFIENSGTQYIDTGIYPNGNTKIEMRATINQFSGTSNKQLYNARGNNKYYGCSYVQGNRFNHYYGNYWTDVLTTTNTPLDIHIIQDANNIDIEFNSSSIENTRQIFDFISDYTLFIFGANNSGNLYEPIPSMKLYDFAIWENGDTLSRDFIPCKRNNDNAIGVYDLVTNEFFENRGTGNFIAGSEIVPGIDINDFVFRLKLPLPHYFPHPVIYALQRAAAGTQTADDTEILQHYLTPLGIGGI